MTRFIPLLSAVFFASIAQPVVAQAPSAYEAGVAARQAGDPERARALLRTWLESHPDDADARLQLAYADLALGNLDAAQAGFEAVLRQAPDYRDARDGLAAVSARRAAPPDAVPGFVLFEGAISTLSNGARDWTEVAAEVEAPTGPRSRVGVRSAYYRRFGLDDVELTGRIALNPSADLWLRGHVGWTPKADFRPRVTLGGGADKRIGKNTVATFDGAWQRFPLQSVVTINPGLVQYVANGAGWITVRGIGTVADGGKMQVGGLIRGDWQPSDHWRVFAGAANGPDTDLGIVTRTTSVFGGMEAPLGERFGMTGSIARDWRDVGSDRTEFRLGLKARF